MGWKLGDFYYSLTTYGTFAEFLNGEFLICSYFCFVLYLPISFLPHFAQTNVKRASDVRTGNQVLMIGLPSEPALVSLLGLS